MLIRFTISHRSHGSRARVGRVETPHGHFDTPAFMRSEPAKLALEGAVSVSITVSPPGSEVESTVMATVSAS